MNCSRAGRLPGMYVVGTGSHATPVTGVGAREWEALTQLSLAGKRVSQLLSMTDRHVGQSGGHGPASVVTGKGTHGVGGVHGAERR